MKKRQITLMTLGILIVILSMVGVSYSYYTANIKEINKTDTVVKTDKLTLTYTGTKEIEVYNLIPGSSYQKTFKVYNDSTKAVTYNIYMEQIINDFECGFNYSIEYEGKKLIEKSQLPATNTNKEYLVYEMHIGAKETQNFTMTINYENLGYNQNIDKGAEFIGTLGIDTIQFKITKPNGNYTALINSAIANECGSKTENDCESGECKKELIPTICEDNTCIKKEEIVVLEKEEEVEKEGEIQKEVAIAHDIYYSDETKYKNGENKRYVTYCTEYQKDNKKYVKYCTKEGQSGKCKIVETTNNCSYKTAMKDLGRTSFQYQSFRENFADTGNGNWHVQTYCSTKQIGIKTDYETGIYYCSAKQNLHDWYILNEQGKVDLTNDFIGTHVSSNNKLWVNLEDGYINMGIWEESAPAGFYIKPKIIVPENSSATVSGKVKFWTNSNYYTHSLYVGFSEENDINVDNYIVKKEIHPTQVGGVTDSNLITSEDFSITISEPGEYYFKTTLVMNPVSWSVFSHIYDLKVTIDEK